MKQFFRLIYRDETTVIDYTNPVADSLNVVEDMRAHKNRCLFSQFLDQTQDIPAPSWIQRAYRFIQKEDTRSIHKCLSQPESLSHAATEPPDPTLCGFI